MRIHQISLRCSEYNSAVTFASEAEFKAMYDAGLPRVYNFFVTGLAMVKKFKLNGQKEFRAFSE
jgi:hypothetical protein